MSERGNIKDLTFDGKNFNKHSAYGMGLLEKSVSKFGMGRSILVDKHNRIIAGNGITETAGNIGIEQVRFIDTDGREIIAVRRNDIDLDTPDGREMALADNATSAANLDWDTELIEDEVGINTAEDWGLDEWDDIEADTPKTESVVVEVKCDTPEEALLLCGKLTDEGYEAKVK